MAEFPASAAFRAKVWQVAQDGLSPLNADLATALFSSFVITYANEYAPDNDFLAPRPEYAETTRFLISLQNVRYLIYWLVLVLADCVVCVVLAKSVYSTVACTH